MNVGKSFNFKLAYGNELEVETLKEIQSQLPDNKAFITNQEPGAEDRFYYKTADIVVLEDQVLDGSSTRGVLFSVECKRNTEWYRTCFKKNGWNPENNVVINLESMKRYKEADFTIYIVSHQSFEDHQIDYFRFYPISLILKGKRPQVVEYNGVTKLNFDASTWYKADTLKEVIETIKKQTYGLDN